MAEQLPDPIPLKSNRRERPHGRIEDFAFLCRYDESLADFIYQFMTEYAGDPYTPSQLPEIVSSEGISYDCVKVSSITKSGKLIHVRETSDTSVMHEQRYRVIVADIWTREVIDNWRVKEIRYSHDYTGAVIQTDLILADAAFDVYSGTAHMPDNFDDPEVEMAWRQYEEMQVAADMRQARIMLGKGRFAFKPFDGEREAMTPLQEVNESLVYRLPKLSPVSAQYLGKLARSSYLPAAERS